MKYTLHFADGSVAYETFLKDLAAQISLLLKCDKDDPEFVSQRKAFKMFGRANVERWRLQGLIVPSIRPGRLEYCTAELRLLQRTIHDETK